MGVKAWDPPRLCNLVARHGEEKKASFWELFFDLVLVAAVSHLAHFIMHSFDPENEHHSSKVFGANFFGSTLILFIVYSYCFWHVWLVETTYQNRFDGNDDVFGRLMSLLLMIEVGAMANAVIDGIHSEAVAEFAFAFLITRLLTIIKQVRALFHLPREIGEMFFFFTGGEVVLVGLLIPATITASGLNTQVVMLLAPMFLWGVVFYGAKKRRAVAPLNAHHYPERFGVLTILLLGEIVMGIAANGEFGIYGDLESLVATMGCFLVTFGLWWTYFDNMTGRLLDFPIASVVWIHAHVTLMIGLIAQAASMTYIIQHLTSAKKFDVVSFPVSCTCITSFSLVTMSIGVISLLTMRSKDMDNNMYAPWKQWVRVGVIVLFCFIFQCLQFLDWTAVQLLIAMASFSIVRVTLDILFLIERMLIKHNPVHRQSKAGLGENMGSSLNPVPHPSADIEGENADGRTNSMLSTMSSVPEFLYISRAELEASLVNEMDGDKYAVLLTNLTKLNRRLPDVQLKYCRPMRGASVASSHSNVTAQQLYDVDEEIIAPFHL